MITHDQSRLSKPWGPLKLKYGTKVVEIKKSSHTLHRIWTNDHFLAQPSIWKPQIRSYDYLIGSPPQWSQQSGRSGSASLQNRYAVNATKLYFAMNAQEILYTMNSFFFFFSSSKKKWGEWLLVWLHGFVVAWMSGWGERVQRTRRITIIL